MLTSQHHINNRKSSVETWASNDNLNNYKEKQPDGRPNYSLSDVSYTFNSDGFRCDEFTTPSDLPILFAGCSFTEGEGLPLEHTWPYMYLQMLKEQKGNESLTIPHHSVALGGSGVDTAAIYLPTVMPVVKPKILLYLNCSWYRRSLSISPGTFNHWLPNCFFEDDSQKNVVNAINYIASDPAFAALQTVSSLHTINLLAKKHNIKCYIMTLYMPGDLEVDFTQCSHLTEVRLHTIPYRYQSGKQIETSLTWARDNCHYGAKWQATIAYHAAVATFPYLDPNYVVPPHVVDTSNVIM